MTQNSHALLMNDHSPLLRLPSQVRHSIYAYVCVSQGHLPEVIVFNKTPPAFNDPRNLFLTCRTIYDEAARIFYSSHAFLVKLGHPSGLEALQKLTTASISYLKQLTIQLNVTASEHMSCPCGALQNYELSPPTPLRPPQHDSHNHVLDTASSDMILSDWQSASTYLQRHIIPMSLSLHLVCDVTNVETAALTVEPLANLPQLADCSIRLSRGRNYSLSELARNAVETATGRPKENSCFRFMSLPQEIRLQILEYTDLVTPQGEVEWNPLNNFYLRNSSAGAACSAGKCHPCVKSRMSLGMDTFCRRKYSAFSSDCRCWLPPTYLFLICKRFSDDAQVIFFSKNRFGVVPSRGARVGDDLPPRLELSEFLSEQVPARALYHIKYIEVVFFLLFNEQFRYDDEAYQDWCQTLHDMEEKLNLPNLTLRIIIAHNLPRYEHNIQNRLPWSEQAQNRLEEAAARWFMPFHAWKNHGFRRFITNITFPSGVRRAKTPVKTVRMKMEKRVMGDSYESHLLSREFLSRSQWRKVHKGARKNLVRLRGLYDNKVLSRTWYGGYHRET